MVGQNKIPSRFPSSFRILHLFVVFFWVPLLAQFAVFQGIAASVAEFEASDSAAVVFAGTYPGIVAATYGAFTELLPSLGFLSAQRRHRPPPAAAVLCAVLAPPAGHVKVPGLLKLGGVEAGQS